LVHLGTGLVCGYKIEDLVSAGVRFKALLATWHALINDKLGGDPTAIRKSAEHFIKSWEALGFPVDKVEFIWPDEVYDDIDYWEKVVRVSKEMTIARARRTMEIMGREEMAARKVSDLLYTPMQVADIFHLDAKICQLGMDQRKANVVAREIGPKLGFYKPVCVHHHILQGLGAPPGWDPSAGEDRKRRMITGAKMSKSKPESAIFIFDSPEAISEKVKRAFAPPKETEFNPVLDMVKYIVFRERKEFTISRSSRFGGDVTYGSYGEVEQAYSSGRLHPADLKTSVADFLIERLRPVREYFSRDEEAMATIEMLRKFQ
jgi:tyrosyl-tRNA synthetase